MDGLPTLPPILPCPCQAISGPLMNLKRGVDDKRGLQRPYVEQQLELAVLIPEN